MNISFLKPSQIRKSLKNSKSGQKEPKNSLQKVFLLLKYQKLLTFLVKNPKRKIFMFFLVLLNGITLKLNVDEQQEAIKHWKRALSPRGHRPSWKEKAVCVTCN